MCVVVVVCSRKSISSSILSSSLYAFIVAVLVLSEPFPLATAPPPMQSTPRLPVNCKSTSPFSLWLSECRGIFRLNRRIAIRLPWETKFPGFLSICGLLALALLLSRLHPLQVLGYRRPGISGLLGDRPEGVTGRRQTHHLLQRRRVIE